MAWRLKAQKGRIVTESGSSKKVLIQKRAKQLREAGWKVRVYQIK